MILTNNDIVYNCREQAPGAWPILEPGDIGVGAMLTCNGCPCCFLGWMYKANKNCSQKIADLRIDAMEKVWIKNPSKQSSIAILNDESTPETRVKKWEECGRELGYTKPGPTVTLSDGSIRKTLTMGQNMDNNIRIAVSSFDGTIKIIECEVESVSQNDGDCKFKLKLPNRVVIFLEPEIPLVIGTNSFLLSLSPLMKIKFGIINDDSKKHDKSIILKCLSIIDEESNKLGYKKGKNSKELTRLTKIRDEIFDLMYN